MQIKSFKSHLDLLQNLEVKILHDSLWSYRASLCATHLGKAPSFVWDKVLLKLTYYDLAWHLMIVRVWDHKWYPTLASNAIYCSLKCKIDKSMASLMLEPLVTCLCAHGSCCTSTWFSFIFVPCNICFVSTIPWIWGVHNRSQTNRCTYLRNLDGFLGAWEKVMRSVLAYAHTNVILYPLVRCFIVDMKRKSSGLWDVYFSQNYLLLRSAVLDSHKNVQLKEIFSLIVIQQNPLICQG